MPNTALAGVAPPPLWDPAAASRDLIRDAHQRSAGFGLRESDTVDAAPLATIDLQQLLAVNQALTHHALPVMETLYLQIAGTRSMVLLTDSQGAILHSMGDADFVSRAQRVTLQPGGVWSEERKGTNAIGTALCSGQAVQVHAADHYLRSHQFLTCACAPILDPHGQVLGALDVSGDHRAHSRHTMALVRMSAQMVENHLWLKSFEDAVRLRFHARAEFLGTLMEGLAAFTPDGRFLSANRSGQFQLGMSAAVLGSYTFASLFGKDMATTLEHARSSSSQPLQLRLPGGVTVVAQVEFRHAPRFGGWTALDTASVPSSRPAMPAQAGAPFRGLRELDTGDAQLAQALGRVQQLLGRDIATLILGETGTGKELMARAIHHDGPRGSGPFVAVNCASIPESLIESELFGYEEGAFTGARRKGNIGKIVQAHGGTLFLDEIGDMPLALQARLLRVLQERSVVPLGGGRAVDVDVHVVCATHRNLREMMAQGSFRQDLYYRLNGLVVRLPALRCRTDLETLIARIVQEHARQPLAISAGAMELLRRSDWPGNLRQLSNVLRTATLLAEGRDQIGVEHLPDDFLEELTAQSVMQGGGSQQVFSAGFVPPASEMPVTNAQHTPVRSLQEETSVVIERALVAHGGNVSAVAKTLGVSRNTVYRHLQKGLSVTK